MPADEDGRLYMQCTCKNINGDVPPDEAWEEQNRLYLGKLYPPSAFPFCFPTKVCVLTIGWPDEVVVWENGRFNCLFD